MFSPSLNLTSAALAGLFFCRLFSSSGFAPVVFSLQLSMHPQALWNANRPDLLVFIERHLQLCMNLFQVHFLL